MPIDDVQRFERLAIDAMYLQELAYTGADVNEINEFTDEVRDKQLLGVPISITGGLVEVVAFDSDFEEARMFVPVQDEISGVYSGLTWRPETLIYPDGSKEQTWRICHCVGSDAVEYVDENGDHIKRTPITYVTIEGSELILNSFTGSHDYRRISKDAVSLLIDQIAIDEESEMSDKAERIAKFFNIRNYGSLSKVKQFLMRDRLSYLNHIGLFEGTSVSSSIGLLRKGDELSVMVASNSIVAPIKYVSIDMATNKDGKVVEESAALSYEVDIEGFGHVSIPHIPGITKVSFIS